MSLRAHPRAGGENALKPGTCEKKCGSSPRGRGKLFITHNTLQWIMAHPRAGGENVSPRPPPPDTSGSSPRGRGKPRRRRCPQLSRRLIPARAGKTFGRGRGLDVHWAHPRAGGENNVCRFGRDYDRGSSPRGRGKQLVRFPAFPVGGLIPARAGKTGRSVRLHCVCPAHPRAGGENATRFMGGPFGGGSSPRGRGKRLQSRQTGSRPRLIPARAGKTN